MKKIIDFMILNQNLTATKIILDEPQNKTSVKQTNTAYLPIERPP